MKKTFLVKTVCTALSLVMLAGLIVLPPLQGSTTASAAGTPNPNDFRNLLYEKRFEDGADISDWTLSGDDSQGIAKCLYLSDGQRAVSPPLDFGGDMIIAVEFQYASPHAGGAATTQIALRGADGNGAPAVFFGKLHVVGSAVPVGAPVPIQLMNS